MQWFFIVWISVIIWLLVVLAWSFTAGITGKVVDKKRKVEAANNYLSEPDFSDPSRPIYAKLFLSTSSR